MKLSAEATRLFVEFHNRVEQRIGPDGDLAPIRAFASKAAEHAVRLGATLALVDEPECEELDAAHMVSGVALAEFYVHEWLRLHEAGTVSEALLKAERLLVWLQTRWQEPVIGLPEIYQRGPNSLRSKADALGAVHVLAQHGWLRPAPSGVRVCGVLRKEVWEIVSTSPGS